MFSPTQLGLSKEELDSALIADPNILNAFPEAKEYVDSLMSARGDGMGQMFREEWVEEAKTQTDGIRVGDNIPGVLVATEDPPFVLEFALSRDGEILSLVSFASVAPDTIPGWAWQAYLEGLVVSARGRAALTVCEEEGRIAGLFAGEDDDEPWDEEDDLRYDELVASLEDDDDDDDFAADEVEPIF